MKAYCEANKEKLRAYKAEWRAKRVKDPNHIPRPKVTNIGNEKWQALTAAEERWWRERRTGDNSLVGAAGRA